MADAQRVAKAARIAAHLRREANAWNYNPIEVAANEAAAQAMEELALELERPSDDD